MGVGCHIHVEMVAEEIAFPVGVPSPVAVWLGITAFAAAGRGSVLLTAAGTFFSLLCSNADRGTVTGKGQMGRLDQPCADGLVKELLFVETENKKKRVLRFQAPAVEQREQPGSGTGRITRGLIAFLFPFRRFHFRETFFGRKAVTAALPDTGKEIIKSPDTGSIPKRKTTKDCIERSFP